MTTATTTRTSAYPPAIADLIPRARELADRLGQIPSRNRLKTELRIGAPKANAVLEALTATDLTPAKQSRPDPVPVEPVDLPTPDIVPAATEPDTAPTTAAQVASEQVAEVVDPVPTIARASAVRLRGWPVLLLALPAFVAIWSGWVGLGGLTGFGRVHPLPGIWDGFELNTAITLPIGVETYAAYALRVWLSPGVPVRARQFARWSAIGSLALGALGQVAYHLMTAAGMTRAPWQITTLVACLPVAVLGMGAALAHLLQNPDE